MGDTATTEGRVAAIGADVLCADDAAAPPPEDERSGVARVDSSIFGEEAALALAAQLRAQTETLLQERLPISAHELEDWVALSVEKGVSGLLLAEEAQQVMVLGPGGAVPTAPRFRDALGTRADPGFCLLRLPETRVRMLTEPVQTWFDDEVAALPEIRVAVIHRDREVRALWQHHLAFAGAEVLFDEVEDAALATLGESAPDLLVIHEHALPDLTRAGAWADVRLQFSALLVVSADCARELHPEDLVAEAADMLATQASWQARIAAADVLVAPVESLGPARWLRELRGYDGLVELRMHAPDGTGRVRMESGELHEARYWRDGEELQGTAALEALQSTRCGSLIVGPAPQVAGADLNHRAPAAPSPVLPQPSTVARAPSSAPEVAHAGEPSSLPVGQRVSHARPIAIAALALVATVGAALRWTPTSRPSLAAVGAAQHAARPVARAPRAQAVVVPAAAETSSAAVLPSATDIPIGPSVTQAADEASSVAAPVMAPTASASQAPAPAAPATRSASAGVGNGASTDASALPVRLRRWLEPTPAQKRVIDAFWARADKNFIRAERLLTEANALDPKEPEVAYQLALTYARMGRLEQTLRWARQARELSPLDPAPVALEGDIHLLRGQRLDAERTWKQCLQVRPGDAGCVRRLQQLKPGSGL